MNEAIEPPDNQYVASLAPGRRVVEAWTAARRPRNVIREDFRATRSREGLQLQIEILIVRGDAGVAELHPSLQRAARCPFHGEASCPDMKSAPCL